MPRTGPDITARWRSSTPPAGFADHRGPRTGIVRLPLHLWWSGPSPEFDLEDPGWRHYLYKIVLTEGTHDDVLTYLDPDVVVEEWDELSVPQAVREAWGRWVAEQRAKRRSGA